MKKEKRIIKLQPKYMNDWRNVGTQLRFGGKWLRELGFEPGEEVEISGSKQCITIKPVARGDHRD